MLFPYTFFGMMEIVGSHMIHFKDLLGLMQAFPFHQLTLLMPTMTIRHQYKFHFLCLLMQNQ